MITDSEIRQTVTTFLTSGRICATCAEDVIAALTRENNRTLADRVQEIVAEYPEQKIQGIKAIRLRFALGLREAKEAYEQGLVKYREQQLMAAIDSCSTSVTPLLTQVTLDRPPF
jgi:ribosomal protein L7/L12